MQLRSCRRARRRVAVSASLITFAALAAGASPALARTIIYPNALLVSRSVYDNPANVTVGETSAPGLHSAPCVFATDDGSYPTVFNNALADGSFGITSPIYLDQLTPTGTLRQLARSPEQHLRTAFRRRRTRWSRASRRSRKWHSTSRPTDSTSPSWATWRRSTRSTSRTRTLPGSIDPSNPVPSAYPRVVAQLDSKGNFRFTETNAYSGNNGRAAILNAAAQRRSTPRATPATAGTLNRTGSSSAPARRSSTRR